MADKSIDIDFDGEGLTPRGPFVVRTNDCNSNGSTIGGEPSGRVSRRLPGAALAFILASVVWASALTR
jgi:hypothetical protein